jgi:hypothetical protein
MAAKQGSNKAKSVDSTEESKKSVTASKDESTAKGDDMDEGRELDSLLALLENEELTSVDPEAATEMLDHWQSLLKESDEPGLADIADSLKKLKKSLTSKKPKSADIAESLMEIGDQVDGAAGEAKRGYKTKLHTLGKSLRKAGETLEEAEDEE